MGGVVLRRYKVALSILTRGVQRYANSRSTVRASARQPCKRRESIRRARALPRPTPKLRMYLGETACTLERASRRHHLRHHLRRRAQIALGVFEPPSKPKACKQASRSVFEGM